MSPYLVGMVSIYFQLMFPCVKPLSIRGLFYFRSEVTSCTIVLVESNQFNSGLPILPRKETIGNLLESGDVFQEDLNILSLNL